MPVSDQNIGFNDITQELYNRVPQVGDNLLQMFEDAPTNGFDPLHDVGAAGPGDAMSEFRAFIKTGLSQGSWDSFHGKWYSYTPDNIFQKYFSSGSLQMQVGIFEKKPLPGEEATDNPLDIPITATLKLGGVTISTTDTSLGIGDFISFKIKADSNIPDGVYNMDSDITVTLQDASGFITNAPSGSLSTHLHIYGHGTSAYRWQWSSSDTDSYPIVYPTVVYSITPPLLGVVPGSSSPAINVKVTDMAGFSDIKAFVSLRFKGQLVGNEIDGWVALGSSFILNTNKKLIFNVQIIRDYIDAGTDMTAVTPGYLPIIKITFGSDAFESFAILDTSAEDNFFQVTAQSDTIFNWKWFNLTTSEDPEIPEDPTDTTELDGTTDTTDTTDTTTSGTSGTTTKDSPLLEIIE